MNLDKLPVREAIELMLFGGCGDCEEVAGRSGAASSG